MSRKLYVRLTFFVVLGLMLSTGNALGAGFSDDFDRPDGEVENGWAVQEDGTIEVKIVNNEVLIAGTQGTNWVRSGISRDVVDETMVSCDFKAGEGLNFHIRINDAATSAYCEIYSWGGPLIHANSEDGGWPGWTDIAGSNIISGAYNNVALEIVGGEVVVTLNGTVVASLPNASLTSIGSVLIASDAAAGDSGSLHIDNVIIGAQYTAVQEIAISTQAGWFGQAAADREAQEIADNVKAARVERFAADQQAALSDWVIAHTGDGIADLLILCGQFPDTIYAPGNAQADDSLAELFLDDGNIIVNTGDYMFFVVNGGGTNAEGGLQTMMDIAGITMWGDNTPVALTSEGRAVAPSLQDFQTDRPFALDQLEGDWVPELILAQNDAGTRADPVIVLNTVTGGRLGIFYQTASQDNDPRGEVISEWINNWYLTDGAIPNAPAWKPVPADGTIDADVASLEWTTGYGAVSHKVYLSADATIDDADLIGETDVALQVAVLDPGVTYYWRVDEVDAEGNVIEGPVWSFSTLPLEAHFPSPADGATNAISVELSWTPGKDAIMHNVHYGTDPAVLLPVQMMSMETSYDPGALDPATTYYWRVDEFTPAGTVAGPVWSFSTIGDVTPSGLPDLIAQFEFDEDASTLSALDTSGNGHHGPLLGDASIAGGVLSVDGSGDAVDAGSDPSFHPVGAFSISALVRMSAWGGSWGNAIAGTRGESGLGWQLRRHSGNQNLTFTVRGTPGADDPRGSIVPPLNEWIHVAAVFDPDGGTRSVYINGALDVQIADSGSVSASDHHLFIGSRASGGNTPEGEFNGDIDYVHIYSRALGVEEIRVIAGVEKEPWSPAPANGASGQPSSTTLSWNAGEGAVEQDVYLGTDAAAVAAADATDATGIYRGRQAETAYAPDALANGTTYYWRVDQVDTDGNIVKGSVWRFAVARAVPAYAALAEAPTDVSGFVVRSLKAQSEINNFAEMNAILDTGLLDGQPPVDGSEGTRIDEFVNLRDTGNGAFGDDRSFPGTDPDEFPAQDPAAGDDDNDFATEILGTIQLTAGVHTIGANSDDGTIVWVGGIEIGRSEELKGTSNRDFTFEVIADGFYTLRARTFERGGGASIELHEILADGTRLLLNDVANGGSAVFAGIRTQVYDFETDAQGWGNLKRGTAVTVVGETHAGGGSQSLRATIDEAAHAQTQGGMQSGRDFTANDAQGAYSTMSFWYRADDPDFNGGNFVFHWIMSTEGWSGGGWYGNGLWGVVIADGQWHKQTLDLSILGEAAGGWQGTWGDQAAWDFRDDLLYNFELMFEPADSTTTGSNVYIDDVVFK